MQAQQTTEKSSTESAHTDDQHQYLSFAQGSETFAVGILHVKEILEYGDVAPVPMVPLFIRGVINLRGRVVPVVDLGARFGRPPCPVTKRTSIIIVEGQAAEMPEIGLVVDAVHTILEIPPREIEGPPAFGAKIRTDFITGMGKVNGTFIIILNLDSVLSIEEMAQLMRAPGEAA